MRNVFQALKLAFAFLTVLPVGAGVEYNDKTFKTSIYFYPVVGLFTGLVLFGLAKLCAVYFIKYQLLSAILLLTIEYAISNFFHIDGFCDTVDALYFTKPGKDKLAILRDPHIGAYAVCWLVLLILFKFCAYQICLTTSDYHSVLLIFR